MMLRMWLSTVRSEMNSRTPISLLLRPIIGEGSLCLWLLVAGVNVQRWKEQASAAIRMHATQVGEPALGPLATTAQPVAVCAGPAATATRPGRALSG